MFQVLSSKIVGSNLDIKGFRFESKMTKHVDVHHKDGSIRCLKCDIIFEEAKDMEEHVKHCYLQCPCCKSLFRDTRLLERHIQRMHREFLRNCPHCDKELDGLSFAKHSKMCQFITKEHKKALQPVNTCPQCQAVVKDLKYHINTVHVKSVRYNCPFCYKAGFQIVIFKDFQRDSDLKKNMGKGPQNEFPFENGLKLFLI